MDEKEIYLDYNSTTPLDPKVIEIMTKAMVDCWANPSSNSRLGSIAKKEIENSRFQISKMINSKQDEIIFTSGGTESSNMIIKSAIEEYKKLNNLKPHIVTTTVEHDATSKLLKKLTQDNKIDITSVNLNKNGTLSEHKIIESITDNTCLLTIMLANNETGIIFPVENIARRLKTINEQREKSKKIYFHTDAAQAIGKIPVDVQILGVDYMTIVGHKFYGPRIGCVYYKNGSPLHPLLYGGGQENGYRSGTENTLCIIGLGQASKIVFENIHKFQPHFKNLRNHFEEKINKIGKINFSNVDRLPNTSSVCFIGKNGKEVLNKCKYVIASTGAACHSGQKQPSGILSQFLTYDEAIGTIRISFGRETTLEDVDASVDDFIQALN